MKQLWLPLFCLAIFSCIAADPPVTGWPCVHSAECGKALKYVCHLGRCSAQCQLDTNCSKGSVCKDFNTYKVCTSQSTENATKEDGAAQDTPATDQRTPEQHSDTPPDTRQANPDNAKPLERLPETKAETRAEPTPEKPKDAGPCQSSPEACDGKDNDCDGQIDEDFPNKGKGCSVGKGPCASSGKQVCNLDGSGVTCDATPRPPKPERCNGIDDDCDGSVDEDYANLGQACVGQGKGECLQSGKFVCDKGQLSTICDATPGTPRAETCDNKDNDCDGKIDNITGSTKALTRTCYTGLNGTQNIGECRAGTNACTNGQWSTACDGQVTPKTKDDCKGKDDNCNGVIGDGCGCISGNKRACGEDKGQCKKGQQTCNNNGSWGACVGVIGPKAEVCDGKDNDCDGSIDEDFNLGASCTVGVGACAMSGQVICDGTSKTKCDAQQGSPTTETCNGKDDNCDGLVDEGNPGGGTACTAPGAKGNCQKGIQSCQKGVLTCLPGRPTDEVCRNNQDDDCDGSIDEICGPLYPHFAGGSLLSNARALTRSDGSSVSYGFEPPNRVARGRYRLKALNRSRHDCNKLPIFVAPYSHFRRAVSYSCSTRDYNVNISEAVKHTNTNSRVPHGDGILSAVIPDQPHDTWATLTSSCSGNCSLARSQGSITIARTGTGVYRVNSPRCDKTTHPIFTIVIDNNLEGWITARNNGNNTCTIRTFDGTSQPSSDIRFAVWLPDPTKVAWAAVIARPNQLPTIANSNRFDLTTSLWSAQRINLRSRTCPPGVMSSNCQRTRLDFPGWRNDSAVLLQYSSPTSQTAGTSSWHPIQSGSGHFFVSSFINNGPEVVEEPFFVLSVQ